MTPVGHFASSMIVGTVAWKLTGSPVTGGIAAVLTHLPADLLFNEFYEWGSKKSEAFIKKFKLFVMLVPAMFLIYSCISEFQAYHQMMFGFLGCLLDVDDAIKEIFGMPIMPCHPGSIYYIPAVWFNNWTPPMLKLHETALWESVLTLVSVFTVMILK